MRKYLALPVAVLALAAFSLPAAAYAQAPSNTVTPTPPNSAKPLSPQQQKMKDCALKYHEQKIAKDKYHSFMHACMSEKPNSTVAPASSATPAK